jgi:two-component system, chemotaxis family, protein-glutamate methylesterase/glutaminase
MKLPWNGPPRNKNIVVMGASAGGIPVLKEIVARLSSDLNAAIFVVLHVGASDPSRLADILQKPSRLPVTEAEDGESIAHGHVYVARPDYHLVLEQDTVLLARGPKENRARPSIDVLFRSAAYAHGTRVIAVVLSGALDDGSAGLWWVKERGGTAIVQEPEDAEFPFMPRNALRHVIADQVLPAQEIGAALVRLTSENAIQKEIGMSKELEIETRIARDGQALNAGAMELGPISPYTCPECHGVLVQAMGGGVPRFRCHTGHAYSINTLLAEVTEYVEDALWSSIRAMEESAMLLRHIGGHIREFGNGAGNANLFDQKASDTMKRADLIRKAVHEHQTLSKDNVADVEPRAR